MSTSAIYVTRESPGLATAIIDLLAASGLPGTEVRSFADLAAHYSRAPVAGIRIVVSTARRGRSEVVDRWSEGSIPGAALVVFAPMAVGGPRGREAIVLDLPVRSEPFIALLRELLARPAGAAPMGG